MGPDRVPDKCQRDRLWPGLSLKTLPRNWSLGRFSRAGRLGLGQSGQGLLARREMGAGGSAPWIAPNKALLGQGWEGPQPFDFHSSG